MNDYDLSNEKIYINWITGALKEKSVWIYFGWSNNKEKPLTLIKIFNEIFCFSVLFIYVCDIFGQEQEAPKGADAFNVHMIHNLSLSMQSASLFIPHNYQTYID